MYGSLPMLPDLRRLSRDKHKIFQQIVLDGALEPLGMPSFGDDLSAQDADAIQAYIVALTLTAIDEERQVLLAE